MCHVVEILEPSNPDANEGRKPFAILVVPPLLLNRINKTNYMPTVTNICSTDIGLFLGKGVRDTLTTIKPKVDLALEFNEVSGAGGKERVGTLLLRPFLLVSSCCWRILVIAFWCCSSLLRCTYMVGCGYR